jgi:Core-2/I-Branching enzyme
VTAGPVVVLILSHRDPPLVHRLTRRLTAGSNTAVVIHHDPTGPALDLPRSDAVLTMPAPQHAEWGRMSLALTVVNGLRFAATHIPELSWMLVISGQDYPTRHIKDIEQDLAQSSKDAYLRYFRVDREPGADEHHWQQLTRRRYLRKIRLPGTHRSVPFPRRHLFDGRDLSLYVGDQWVNLNQAAVHHVLEQQRRLPQVERYFNWCSIPDEGFLSTLLLNNAQHLAIEADRRRYISWTKGQRHPALLEIADVEKAAASTDLFARKVDSERTPDVLDLFDQRAGA